ncbi:terpene synthase family protein [Ktedonospora formicarum]|nr:hypothetical protein [Ktedonospora formicarum]
MEDIQLAPPFCPFVPRISPHVQVAQEHLEAWVQEFRLLQGPSLQRFSKTRMGWLVARCYPTATASELSLLADWLAWLFFVDDLFSEGAISHQPDRIRPVMARLFSIVDGTIPSLRYSDPMSSALHDLWWRTAGFTSSVWRKQFLDHFADYFAGTYWEAQNRSLGLVPDKDMYIEKRRLSSGMLIGIDFIDLVERMDFPQAMCSSDVFRVFLRATNNIVCWSNDIVSLRKEFENNDVNNLVLIIQHTSHCTLQDAVSIVRDLVRAETELFMNIERDLLREFPTYEQEIHLYTMAHRAMVRGNLDWSYETSRYGQAET